MLEQEFENAVKKAKEDIRTKPENEDLLKLYSLYKQATDGDVSGDRPEGFDFKAIAKYNAWAAIKGKSREDAMKEYIELVNRLSD